MYFGEHSPYNSYSVYQIINQYCSTSKWGFIRSRAVIYLLGVDTEPGICKDGTIYEKIESNALPLTNTHYQFLTIRETHFS